VSIAKKKLKSSVFSRAFAATGERNAKKFFSDVPKSVCELFFSHTTILGTEMSGNPEKSLQQPKKKFECDDERHSDASSARDRR
jgi:hypothetical protein